MRVRRVISLAIFASLPVAVAAARPARTSMPVRTMSVVSSTNITSAGGTLFVTGTNFDTGAPPALSIYQNGQFVTQAGANAGYTSTVFSATLPALAAGVYDVLVSGVGGSMASNIGSLTVSTTTTPSVIYSPNLQAEYDPANAICSGSCAVSAPYTGNCTTLGQTVTKLCDSTGNGQTLTCTNATYNPAEAGFLMANRPSIVFAHGSSAYCTGAFTLGSTSDVTILGSFYLSGTNATGGVEGMVNYHTPNDTLMSFSTTNTLTTFLAGSTTANVASPLISSSCSVDLSANHWSTPTNTISADVDNLALITNTNNNAAVATSGNLFIGATSAASEFSDIHMGLVDVVKAASTTGASSQFMSYVQYVNGHIGCDPVPTLTAATPGQVSNATCGVIISGANYQTGVAVTVGGGIGSVTVNWSSTTAIGITLPSIAAAGSYDVTIANPNGRSQTFNNALVVGTGTNIVCIMGSSGVSWWTEGANWACPAGSGPGGACAAGDSISQVNDISGMGSTQTQATGANQVIVHSLTDSDYGGKPSFAAATPNWMSGTMNIPTGLTATASVDLFVLKQTSTTGVQRAEVLSVGSPLYRLGLSSDGSAGAGKASYLYFDGSANHQAIWGSALSGVSFVWGGSYGAGTVTTFIDVNDDGVSAVTNTTAGSPLYFNTGTPQYDFISTADGTHAPVGTFAYAAHLLANPTTAQAKAICLMLVADFSTGWSCP